MRCIAQPSSFLVYGNFLAEQRGGGRGLATALAAVLASLIMVLVSGVHAMRGEWDVLSFNAVLGGLAAFVAWERWRLAP